MTNACNLLRLRGAENIFNAWSPDGQEVLDAQGATCGLLEPWPNLQMWDLIHNTQEILVEDAGFGAWSPDGAHIAFLLLGEPESAQPRYSIKSNYVDGQPFRLHLIIMGMPHKMVTAIVPLGSEPKKWGRWGGSSFWPVWSPDGKWLMGKDDTDDVFLIRPDGTDRQALTHGLQVRRIRQWSPNGRRLAIRVVSRGALLSTRPDHYYD